MAARTRQGRPGPARPGAMAPQGRPGTGLLLGSILVFLAAGVHLGLVGRGASPPSRTPEDNRVCWSNPAVTGPSPAQALLGRYYSAESEGFRHAIRPLPLVLLRIEHSAFGDNGSGYRVIQLLLLGAAGVFLFLLLASWWGSAVAAGAAAMLLVVHPVAVPAVAGIAGVGDLLALSLLLSALWAARSGRSAMAASGLVLLATLSAEMAFAVIPVLGVWAWTRRRPDALTETGPRTAGPDAPAGDPATATGGVMGNGPARAGGLAARLRSWVWGDPVAVFAVGAAAAGLLVLLYRAVVIWTLPQHLKFAQAIDAWSGVGFGRRVLVASAAVFESFRLIVFPWPIGYANDYLLTSGLTPLRAGAGLVVLLALGWALVHTVRRRDAGAFWIALVLFPVLGASGLFFSTGAILPARTLLFVVPGVAGLAVWGAGWLRSRWPSSALSAVLLVLAAWSLGLAGWRSLVRGNDYTDWQTLVERQTAEFPRSAQGWYDLGNLRMTGGNAAAARAAFEEALQLRSDCWEAWVNLGVLYSGNQEWGLAMRSFTQVAEGAAGRRALRIVWARARYHQGLIFMTQAKNVAAAACFEDMLAVFPDHLFSHANLGRLYSNNEHTFDRARRHLERAQQLETDSERKNTLEGYINILARREANVARRSRARGGEPGQAGGDSLP